MSWENNIRRVVPYVPGEQPQNQKVIKLNTNENPYPPSPKVEQILREYDSEKMRLYPDPDSKILVNAIAENYGVSPKNVFVGVGSDDVISMAFLTFFHSDKPVLFPDITYAFYDVWADVYGIPYETKPLNENFEINPEDYCTENGGIIFPNPNAPTGLEMAQENIIKILEQNPDSVVIVDEAYVDFAKQSALPLLKRFDNLLVVQTYSKSRSMAGMRIGFAIGSEKMIQYMNDVKFSINSYTMNPLTILCGAAAIKDTEYFKSTVEKIIATRERTKKELEKLGFSYLDSASNFIFAKHNCISGSILFQELKKRGIFVRHWNKDRIADYLRISIGTDAEMDALIVALKELTEQLGGSNA